jgi:hypothetical protein
MLRPLVVMLVAVAAMWPAPIRGWQRTQPFIGVTYYDRALTEPRPIRMHVAQIDLRAPGRGGSEGMKLTEVAAVLLREFGVFDALNLDGGGSTTMAMEDPVQGPTIVNVSSDSAQGRAVATSLAVFATRR